jgi:hypothetical protein
MEPEVFAVTPNPNDIASFLEQCVAINAPECQGIDITALYGRYLSWAMTSGAEPVDATDFAIALRHQGIPHDDGQGPVRFYPGLELRDTLPA